MTSFSDPPMKKMNKCNIDRPECMDAVSFFSHCDQIKDEISEVRTQFALFRRVFLATASGKFLLRHKSSVCSTPQDQKHSINYRGALLRCHSCYLSIQKPFSLAFRHSSLVMCFSGVALQATQNGRTVFVWLLGFNIGNYSKQIQNQLTIPLRFINPLICLSRL